MKNKNSIDVEPFLSILKILKENGNVFPNKINYFKEIEELIPLVYKGNECYKGSFKDFIKHINFIDDSGNKLYELFISNPEFHKVFNALSKRTKLINKIITYIPQIIALILSIFGIINENYYMLFAYPIVLLSYALTILFGGKLFYISMLILLYFLNSWDYNILFDLTLIFLIANFFGHLSKQHKRLSLINVSKLDEEIFCYLFFCNIINIRINPWGTIIRYETKKNEKNGDNLN